LEHKRRGERQLEIPPARPRLAPERDGRLAPGEDCLTPTKTCRLERELSAGVARLAVESAWQNARPEPEPARLPGGAFEPDSIGGDHARHVVAPAADGRPRADQSGAVTRNVREDERDEPCGCR